MRSTSQVLTAAQVVQKRVRIDLTRHNEKNVSVPESELTVLILIEAILQDKNQDRW
jgi:hypothetical protein